MIANNSYQKVQEALTGTSQKKGQGNKTKAKAYATPN